MLTDQSSTLDIHQRRSLEAARRGDFSLLDQGELIYLSLMIRPHTVDDYGGISPWLTDLDAGLVLWPVEIERGSGPTGETLVLWAGVKPCGRCWRRVRRQECARCGGLGHLSDHWEHECWTNLDGLAILDGDRNPII